MAKILCTGIATLDIINTVPHYPAEDEEMRAQAQQQNMGGNAANTSRVLAQHGHEVHFAGVIANDNSGDGLLRTLVNLGIKTGHVQRADGVTPTSYITLNAQNGSRTIVHYRDLPELGSNAFAALPLETFDAFFFEGRNVDQLALMLRELTQRKVDQPVFLELEKPRAGLGELASLADVVLVSRPYAEAQGYSSAQDCLQGMHRQLPGQYISVTWGAAGAAGITPTGEVYTVAAEKVARVVDSLGAGDTYNAGVIDAIVSGQPFADALAAGNRLAARKIQQSGFDGLL